MLRLAVPMLSNKRKPPVLSVVMACDGRARLKGKKKGTRLINLASLLAYIESHAMEVEDNSNE